MLRYAAKRVAFMIPTLVAVALLSFLMLRVIPGDVVEVKLRSNGGAVTTEVLNRERERLGLNKPLPAQFIDWMAGMARLDFGISMWTGKPITQEISVRLGLSMQVALMAALLAVLVAVPLGTVSALFSGSWIDYLVRFITIAGLAVPSFWLGMLIILGLLAVFHWSPPVVYTPFYENPVANLSQLIWPALAVGYRSSAVIARLLRSSILETLQEDYIRTARAKGVYERLVLVRHAMPNALLPAITVIGLEFAFLIGGLMVTEQVFNLNGVGRLFVDAVTRNDFTLIQTLIMLVALLFSVINLGVDLLYGIVDPRIRHR